MAITVRSMERQQYAEDLSRARPSFETKPHCTSAYNYMLEAEIRFLRSENSFLRQQNRQLNQANRRK